MLVSGVVRGWGVVTYASQWCCERVGGSDICFSVVL